MIHTSILQQAFLNEGLQVLMTILLEILNVEQADEVACQILHILVLMFECCLDILIKLYFSRIFIPTHHLLLKQLE